MVISYSDGTPSRLHREMIDTANAALDSVAESGLNLEGEPDNRALMLRHLVAMHGLSGLLTSIERPSRESGQREFYNSLRLGLYAAVWRNPQIFAHAYKLAEDVRHICTAHDKELRAEITAAKHQGVALTLYDEQRTNIALTRGSLNFVSLCLGRATEMEYKQLKSTKLLVVQQGAQHQRCWEGICRRAEIHLLEPAEV